MTLLQLILLLGSVAIGALGGIYLHGRITMDVKIVLAFSGAYLFALAILHLMPDSYGILHEKAGIYILVGFFLQIVLEYFSKGVEHGHLHHSDKFRKSFPLGIYVSLMLHSMIEGLPLAGDELISAHGHHHHHAHDHHQHGHMGALLIGVSIHKVPEALALASILLLYFNNRLKAVLWLVPYALATPLGFYLGQAVMTNASENTEIVYAVLLSIAVGIFLHVSTTIIFEAEEHHKLNLRKSVAILLGIGLVWLSTGW